MSDELIRELEAAEVGSRELDAQIASEFGGLSGMGYETWDAIEAHALHYTTNLDHALTLVPRGWGGRIMWNDRDHGGFVELDLPNPRWTEPECPPEELHKYAGLVSSYDDQEPLKARPLALAVCIAALRARHD